jgi:hypothetical protein
MRAHRLCLICFAAATSVLVFAPAMAQMKLAPKGAAPAGPETRYFTSIDGLMDGNADVILKETRQGKAVTSATLDVCYPAEKGSERKDRFVANLTASGPTLTGTAQTQVDKLPVSVKLTRRPTGDTFEFKGQIIVGQTSNDVTSSDNSDQSEKEFQENQSSDDNIAAAPKDFTEVSPEAVAIKIKLEAALDFVKTLRGQNVEVSLSSLNVACESLRSGEQVLVLGVDPERAAGFVAKAKTYPGVISAGWTSGVVDMDRTIRFAAADWRDGDKPNRDKIASAVAGVLAKTLSARLVTSKWSDDTGKLKLTFKRPSPALPGLELTDTIDVTALVAADRPGGSDRLMLWIGAPSVATADESAGAKLSLADAGSADEEGDVRDDNGAVAALATAFKAQRWDSDNSSWK